MGLRKCGRGRDDVHETIPILYLVRLIILQLIAFRLDNVNGRECKLVANQVSILTNGDDLGCV
jgi:hypothetical protein